MELFELPDVMIDDLSHEWTHLAFYTRAAAMVGGLHRGHLSAFFRAQATSELGHVLSFHERIVALGNDPTVTFGIEPGFALPDSSRDPGTLIRQAIDLEQEVVQNYTVRLGQLAGLLSGSPPEDARSAQVQFLIRFYEDQLEDSHGDLDNLKEMVRGSC